jgi:hypothetical protein
MKINIINNVLKLKNCIKSFVFIVHNVELNDTTLVQLAINMFIKTFVSHKYVKPVIKFVTTKSIFPFTTFAM